MYLLLLLLVLLLTLLHPLLLPLLAFWGSSLTYFKLSSFIPSWLPRVSVHDTLVDSLVEKITLVFSSSPATLPMFAIFATLPIFANFSMSKFAPWDHISLLWGGHRDVSDLLYRWQYFLNNRKKARTLVGPTYRGEGGLFNNVIIHALKSNCDSVMFTPEKNGCQ